MPDHVRAGLVDVLADTTHPSPDSPTFRARRAGSDTRPHRPTLLICTTRACASSADGSRP